MTVFPLLVRTSLPSMVIFTGSISAPIPFF
jgi:hypothetical protein